MVCGLCDGTRGVLQVLNPSIVTLWLQLRLTCFMMLYEDLHLVLYHPNLSVSRLQMAVSEELQAAHAY